MRQSQAVSKTFFIKHQTNERNKPLQNSSPGTCQQQAARLPHHAGHYHRRGIRHHDACYRTRLKEKYPGANLRNGLQHDNDPSGSGYARRRPSRPQRHADPETCRLRGAAQRDKLPVRRQPQRLLLRTAHCRQ